MGLRQSVTRIPSFLPPPPSPLPRSAALDSHRPRRFCYPDFADGVEDTTYTKDWSSADAFDASGLDEDIRDAFAWKSISDTRELFIFPGVIGNYPGSGYMVDFAASAEKRSKQLAELQEAYWIDIKTRAVFLDMAFYNPNTDMFITIRMLFEFHSCGAVTMMPTYRIMRLDKYPMNNFWNFVEIGAQGGVAVMVSVGISISVSQCFAGMSM
jgi:hypothetical protein